MSQTRRPRHITHARRTFLSLFSTARHALRRSRLWKTMGGVIAAVLAIGMVGMGVSLTATAAGSGDPTPYTVTAQGVTLPTGVTFPASGHVNYKATKLDHTGEQSFGVQFDPNNKQPGGRFIGQAFFPFSSVPADGDYGAVTSSAASVFPGGYCITWVQVSMYNEHFGEGGQSPICTTTTVEKPSCVSSPTYSYTFDSSSSSGIITVTKSGAETGDALCAPLYVRAATWNYDLPTDGNSPSWPQTLEGYNDVTVDAIGTFPYAAPNVATCKQHDIYATFDGTAFAKLTLPNNLLGSHNPWEPAFLHETLSSAANGGNSPTYSTDPSTGCSATVVIPVAPTVVDAPACGGYGTVTPVVTAGVTYAVTSFDRQTGDWVVTATPASSAYKFDGDQTVTFTGNAGAYVDCPTVVTIQTDPEAVSQTCVTGELDSTLASGYITVAVTDHVKYSIVGPAPDGTVVASDASATTFVAPGTYTVTATADPGFVLAENDGPVWTLTVTAFDGSCGQNTTLAFLPTAVTSTNQVCTAGDAIGGSITVAQVDGNQFGKGVSYFIDGVKATSATTAKAPGTYHVTATVDDPQDTIDGESSWTITIASPTTACGELTTLAFTGANGDLGVMLIVALFLLLAGAGVYTTGRLRSRES